MSSKLRVSLFALSISAAICALPVTASSEEFDNQWGLAAIHLDKALEKGITGEGVGVAIVENAFQLDHPEFDGSLYQNHVIIPGGSAVHGTHVAGIVGANRDGIGMHGVAPDVLLSSVEREGTGLVLYESVADSYNAALANGLRIFNNSWSWPKDTTTTSLTKTQVETELGANFLTAMHNAVDADAVTVWAAGNKGYANPSIQAGLPYYFPELQANWIAVTAVNPTLNKAGFANACGVAAEWCIAAPGVDIYSTLPTDNYGYMSGTSMAAPHVTGAVALAKQMFPNASGAELASIVLRTATDIGDTGLDDDFGWGFLNVGNLVDTIDPLNGALFANASASRFATTDTLFETIWNRNSLSLSHPSIVSRSYLSGKSLKDEPHTMDYEPLKGVWVQGIGARFDINESETSPEADADIRGVIAGLDLVSTRQGRLGVAVAYTDTDLSTDGFADKADAVGYHGFAYASMLYNRWFVDGIAGVGRFDNEYQRFNILGSQETVLANQGIAGSSSNDTDHFGARLTVGHSINVAQHIVQPYLYGMWNRQKTGGAEEVGADIFSLTLHSNSLDQYEGGIGLRAQFAPYALQNGFFIVPSADVAYGRLGGDRSFPVTVELLGTPIDAEAAEVGENVLRAGGQLKVVNDADTVAGFISYDGKFQEDAQTHSVSGGLTLRF